jgi:hypothetical protein
VKNGAETAADCGGGTCPKCADAKTCLVNADCTSGVCSGTPKVCQTPTCLDTVKNGTETDADCGGSTCPKCATNKACLVANDCVSGVCTAGICTVGGCADSVKNNLETDVDCGGGTCPKCADTKACLAAADCTSGVCTGNACAVPTCGDTVKNGTESDVDCGGSCSKCGTNQICTTAADCQSGVCTANRCATPTCTDVVQNGTETDVDCGGTTCGGCANGKKCSVSADCTSGNCSTGLCAAPPVGISLVNATAFGSGSSQFSFTHTLGTASGNGRLIAILVSGDGNSSANASPDIIRYNNVQATKAHEFWSGNRVWSGIYYLVDSQLPSTTGSYSVTIGTFEFAAVVSVLEFRGVNQTTPIDAFAGSGGGNCCCDDPSDVVTTTTANAWLLSSVATFGTGEGAPLSSQTTVYTTTIGGLGFMSGYRGPEATAGAKTITWDMGNCNASGHTLVAIRP